jgi:hypothetical protein
MYDENNDIREIEIKKEEAQKAIHLKDCLERLYDNQDFKDLILEFFFKEEPVRLVMLKAHPEAENEILKKMIERDIETIGGFRQFLAKIEGLGQTARNIIDSADEEIENIRQEELEQAS